MNIQAFDYVFSGIEMQEVEQEEEKNITIGGVTLVDVELWKKSVPQRETTKLLF